ncbi:hypothetical protein IT779_08515 [Nocardia sp. NEAU-351]|uniref:Uncharacterized protein n=1 Tax=Nocardia bovistercoris TaxID=2785916 RepID=A0A931I7J8_9NOCA|nr:hypothetical protein [Nocardia bovistercoris]MBH0776324.1 hypothetical protein [Nocardia bovistercoris]
MPDASVANVLLVPARNGGHVGLFAVDIAAPGVSVRPTPSADRARCRSSVTYVDARARLLGELPSRLLDAAIDDVQIACAAEAVGAADRLLELTVAHAKVRR